MPDLDHPIWWQVYPLGATGAPMHDDHGADPITHRLARLDAWLDYAVELGCSGLLLGPIFASTSHGYDTLDHFRIDPRLGDDADFDHLIAEARQRGLQVMLDGVFNHVGRHHPWLGEVLAQPGPDPVFRLDWVDGHPVPHAWEGHGDLVEFNHANPQVADFVYQVMVYWLRRGIAGWRLDVAYAVPPQFWATVLPRVRQEFPDAIFLGEVIHGDYTAIAQAGTLDAVTQYELWKAIWSSLRDTNCWELAWALHRHDEFNSQTIMQTFIGNHDVERIASLTGHAGAALAATMLFTLPGMPSVYYGDEQGFRGEKGEGFGADDALRPALPASPAELAPDGWPLYRWYQRLIGLRRRNDWLARSHVEVIGKELAWIVYQCTGQGHMLRCELRVDAEPSARVLVDGHIELSWPAQ